MNVVKDYTIVALSQTKGYQIWIGFVSTKMEIMIACVLFIMVITKSKWDTIQNALKVIIFMSNLLNMPS